MTIEGGNLSNEEHSSRLDQIIQGMSPNVEGYTARGDAAIRFRDFSLSQ